MSYTGKSPTFNSVTMTPQAAPPATPREGMEFISSGAGTYAAGVWKYQGAAWQLQGSGSGEFDFLASKTTADWLKFDDIFTGVSASSTTELVTKTAHGLKTGDMIAFTDLDSIAGTGISLNTALYIVWVSADTFKLATSYANALAGTTIDITTGTAGSAAKYGRAFPVDGTGGSGTGITIAASGANTLSTQPGVVCMRLSKDAANRMGAGVGCAFTTRGLIDNSAMRTLKISVLTSAAYADGDLTCYLYNATDGVIYPADQRVFASSFASKQQFEFQLGASATSYRVIFHVSSTNASAYDVDFIAQIVENKSNMGTIMDQEYTLTVTEANWTTSRAVGVPYKTKDGTWRMTVNIEGTFNTTYTSKSLTVSGVTFYNTGSAIGGQAMLAIGDDGSTNRNLDFVRATDNASTITLAHSANFKRLMISGDVELASKPTWALDNYPIVLGQDAGCRQIAFAYKLTGTQTVLTTATDKAIFGTKLEDTANAFDVANNQYVIPESGEYVFSASMSSSDNWADGKPYSVGIYKGASAIVYEYGNTGTANVNVYKSVTTRPIYCSKGELISVKYYNGDSSSRTFLSTDYTCFSGYKLASPQQIAASEKVYAQYYISSSTANAAIDTTAEEIIDFDTKVFDSHNSVTTGTSWKFTAKQNMIVRVSANVAIASVADQKLIQMSLYKNTSEYTRIGNFSSGTSTNTPMLSTLVSLNIGEYITIKLYNGDASSRNLVTGGAAIYNISIESI